MRNRFILAAMAACFPLVMVSGPVYAGGIDLIDGKNTCTAINCNSQVVRGSIQSDLSPFSKNARWSYTAYCSAGECCRFDITHNDNLEIEGLSMTVVAADVNDTYTEIAVTPTLEIVPQRSGPHTVFVTARLETGDLPSPNRPKRFTLRYGRYNTGNPNCANPDLRLVPQEPQ